MEDTDEIIVSNGGLAVAGALMKSLKIGAGLNKIKVSSEEPEVSNSDVFRSYLGLLLIGKTNYEDIELFSNDEILRVVLVITKVPSAATLRQRFDATRTAFDNLTLTYPRLTIPGAKKKEFPGHTRSMMDILQISPISGKFLTHSLVLKSAMLALNALNGISMELCAELIDLIFGTG